MGCVAGEPTCCFAVAGETARIFNADTTLGTKTLNIKKTKDMGNCSICMEKNNDASINLLCNHRFHHDCLIFLNNNICPLCRRKLSGIPDMMERIIEENENPKKDKRYGK